MVRVEYQGEYYDDLNILLNEAPDLSQEINKRINWFCKNPKDTRLDNHTLTGRLEGKWAFSITDNIRIVYERLGKSSVRFLAIGHHNGVYKKN